MLQCCRQTEYHSGLARRSTHPTDPHNLPLPASWSCINLQRPLRTLAALHLASNIVRFADLSTKLIHDAREIHDSRDTKENKSLEAVTSEMKRLSLALSSPPAPNPENEDEKALCHLAGDCQVLSDEILQLLEKIKPKDPNSMRQSVWSAFKNKFYERQKGRTREQIEQVSQPTWVAT